MTFLEAITACAADPELCCRPEGLCSGSDLKSGYCVSRGWMTPALSNGIGGAHITTNTKLLLGPWHALTRTELLAEMEGQ